VIVAFVDEHRDQLGVEPICRALRVAPSTYYAAKRRESAPSARAIRDAAMMQVLMVLWVANRKVYGAHSSGRPPGAPAMTSAGTRSPV
jgi:putative transposase